MTRLLIIASFAESVLPFRGKLIEALIAKGVSVHLGVPGSTENSEVRRQIEGVGVVVHSIPLKRSGQNPFFDIYLLFRLIRLMRYVRPHITLSYTIKPVIFGCIAAWVMRVPDRFALITGLGYAFTSDRSGVLTMLIKRLYLFSLSRASKVFFQNGDDEALLRKRHIIPSSIPSIVLNGSGVCLEEYEFNIVPIGRPAFLLIARLLGDKGVREYASAARKIRSRYPDMEFRLVGWIDENPDAISQEELSEWIEAGDIEFLGKQADVRPAIRQCTVYVLPSYREGTPRTVLEAMAMGRPIITTDAPGCRETVVDGENGFLVPVKSAQALVAAMQRFIDDPQLAAKMGKRSREIAEEKYDVHKVNAMMLHEMGIT